MSKPERAGAPEDIEVTPEMIEAGMEAYLSVWTDLRDADPGAAEAMLRDAFIRMLRVAVKKVR